MIDTVDLGPHLRRMLEEAGKLGTLEQGTASPKRAPIAVVFSRFWVGSMHYCVPVSDGDRVSHYTEPARKVMAVNGKPRIEWERLDVWKAQGPLETFIGAVGWADFSESSSEPGGDHAES